MPALLIIFFVAAQLAPKQEMLSQAEVLHRAAMRGETAAVEMYLRMGADVNAADSAGRSPLHDACLKGHVDTARLLLDRGAKIAVHDKTGATPLHDAALGGSVKTIELLLARKADADARDLSGQTPLDYALKMERTDAIRALRAAKPAK
ncbi:MAG: ankyrin repeat domain-containing protein [Bryobacteraceae bacterium]